MSYRSCGFDPTLPPYIIPVTVKRSYLFFRAVSIIQSTPVEEEIAKAILQGLRELESSASKEHTHSVCVRRRIECYAVRSSAIGEDSEETSAAGQNSTYLGVKDANDVVRHVARCWASLFSYQSVKYR